MLNFNVWKITIFDIETAYLCETELFEIELSELLQNWLAWNRTVFDIETAYLCLIELLQIELLWHLIICKQKLYL